MTTTNIIISIGVVVIIIFVNNTILVIITFVCEAVPEGMVDFGSSMGLYFGSRSRYAIYGYMNKNVHLPVTGVFAEFEIASDRVLIFQF